MDKPVAKPPKTREPAQRRTAQTLPAPGIYEIDPPHPFAYFAARHNVVGRVRGRFDRIAGTIKVAEDPAACSLDIVIDASSISTQNSIRDDDLRSPAYFDMKTFRMISYQGRGILRGSGESWRMDGSLTARGVTMVVPLYFTFNGTAPSHPGKPARVAFHGSAATKRADFGMTSDLLHELGASTAPDVEIEIDSEALAKLPNE